MSSSLLRISAVCLLACVQASVAKPVAKGDERIRLLRMLDGEANAAASRGKGQPVDMSLTFSFNGIPAWRPSLSGTLQNFPARYLPGNFQIATPNNYQFPEDGAVEYDCPPASAGVGPCDVVVFLYECFPCKSLKGGLPAHLLGKGFQRTRCAPTFTVKAGGSQQRMSAYIKTIPAGANEVIYMPRMGKVEFVAFGLSNGGARDCDTLTDQTTCEGNDGHCEWNPTAARCSLATCVQKGPGGCDPATCANEEI